ncbi:solute carrier family 15 member 5 [Acipenser oxyrinchus oxyrinchus]|uniref:Solute carrier family 15 member 5 n=1 Tax=Acipenser oxyrinchus oxyrinchus TaxID=40147 RepID=A0AAD8DBK3_ACIOX|nr:solute carrier family 15 member 5 [Acipenser oxyrinchus oxyrinchus]
MAVIDLTDLQEKSFLKQATTQPRRARRRAPPRRMLQGVVCVLLVELCERFTFFGIVCNMILFCTLKLGYDNVQAAAVNLLFIGACTLTPVLVGWVAESRLGRTKVLYICALLHFIGTAMLPVVAFPFEDFYIDTHHIVHSLARREQTLLFYGGLLSASLGIGGIRAILCPLSAYSLQDCSQQQLLSFFNWFYWLVNLNSVVVFVGIAYIQQSVAKNLGFLIPFTSVLLALITIHMARNKLIYQPKKVGSLLATFGVFLNSLKMCCVRYRHLSGEVSSWLDRAKEHNGGGYSEAHVENVKTLVKLFPFFALQLLYRASVTQIPSGYYIQTMNSNLNLNGFLLPIAAMNVISILPLLVLAPFLECVSTCCFSFRRASLSPTALIIAGHLCAAFSVVVAGISELQRKRYPTVEQALSGKVLHVSSMPCLQLAPQYILLGMAEALVTPACSLVTFCLAPSSIRGISMHFLALSYGGGCFLGAFIIQVIYLVSGGSCFPASLSEGHLEGFFFLLASLMLTNALVFWKISHRYSTLSLELDRGVRGSVLAEKLLEHEKSLKFYDTFSSMETAL